MHLDTDGNCKFSNSGAVPDRGGIVRNCTPLAYLTLGTSPSLHIFDPSHLFGHTFEIFNCRAALGVAPTLGLGSRLEVFSKSLILKLYTACRVRQEADAKAELFG